MAEVRNTCLFLSQDPGKPRSGKKYLTWIYRVRREISEKIFYKKTGKKRKKSLKTPLVNCSPVKQS